MVTALVPPGAVDPSHSLGCKRIHGPFKVPVAESRSSDGQRNFLIFVNARLQSGFTVHQPVPLMARSLCVVSCRRMLSSSMFGSIRVRLLKQDPSNTPVLPSCLDASI